MISLFFNSHMTGNLRNVLLTLFTLTILVSCGNDDDGATPSPLIGIWTYSGIAIADITVGGEDLATYYKYQGLTEEEIEETVRSMEASVEADYEMPATLTWQFYPDNTLIARSPGEDELVGTWSLSEDGKVLELNGDPNGVKLLTSGQLIVVQTYTSGEFLASVELSFTR